MSGLEFMLARSIGKTRSAVRVAIPVASTRVDPRTRAAFSQACLNDLERQLNERQFPVSYEYRQASLAGHTIQGTARTEDKDLVVEAELTPPWWTGEELVRALPTMGGGVAGRILRESHVGQVHVTEAVRLSEVTLLQLHSSANPTRPASEVRQ